MITYCPVCGNMLLVEASDDDELRYYCQCCPYIYAVDRKMTQSIPLKPKKVDDILGGEEAWANVQKTDVPCPIDACGFTKAYFMEVQIRSADEPATLFYKCAKCGHQWREG